MRRARAGLGRGDEGGGDETTGGRRWDGLNRERAVVRSRWLFPGSKGRRSEGMGGREADTLLPLLLLVSAPRTRTGARQTLSERAARWCRLNSHTVIRTKAHKTKLLSKAEEGRLRLALVPRRAVSRALARPRCRHCAQYKSGASLLLVAPHGKRAESTLALRQLVVPAPSRRVGVEDGHAGRVSFAERVSCRRGAPG